LNIRKNKRKTIWLDCWKTDGACSKKLELEEFFSEHGVNISLINETHLESGRAQKFANYIYQRTDSPTVERGTTILVHRGTGNYSDPVSALDHLKATPIHPAFATRLL
jgi:hypothetical protein